MEALSSASVSWLLHLGLIADVVHATSQVLSKPSLALAKAGSAFKDESRTDSKLVLESLLPHEVAIVAKKALVGPLPESPATTQGVAKAKLLWLGALLMCSLLHTAYLVEAREDSAPVVAYRMNDDPRLGLLP